MSKFKLLTWLTLLGIIWGSTIPLTKTAVSTGHDPLGLIAWQLIIATFFMVGLVIWRKSKIVIDRKHILFFAIIAFGGTLIPNFFSYIAAYHLPGGVMALVIALVPIFSLLIALTFRIEKFVWLRMVGVLLGAAAIALLVLPESSLPDRSKVIYVFVGLIAPLFYGIEGNYLMLNRPKDTGPIATLFGASVVGVVVTVPLALLTGTFINPANGIGAPELALTLSGILHVVAYVGYVWLVGQAGSVFASQVAYVVTPAGVVMSILFLDERPSYFIYGALLILMIGLVMVQPKTAQSEEV
jgi:drug/metabolite transporter (DMT)-like permease